MLNESLLPLIKDSDLKMVGVCFTEGALPYHYITHLDLSVGDSVVIRTRENRFRVVPVVEVGVVPPTDKNVDYTFIVCKVDTTEYDRQVAGAQELREEYSRLQFDHWRETMRKTLGDGGSAPELIASTAD